MVAAERTDELEGAAIGHAGQDDFDAKEGEEPFSRRPQRSRAWDRSWRQASVTRPWLPPSAANEGRAGSGAMLATSSRAKTTGAANDGRAKVAEAIWSRSATTSGASRFWCWAGAHR